VKLAVSCTPITLVADNKFASYGTQIKEASFAFTSPYYSELYFKSKVMITRHLTVTGKQSPMFKKPPNPTSPDAFEIYNLQFSIIHNVVSFSCQVSSILDDYESLQKTKKRPQQQTWALYIHRVFCWLFFEACTNRKRQEEQQQQQQRNLMALVYADHRTFIIRELALLTMPGDT
jgi:hypothetical protein